MSSRLTARERLLRSESEAQFQARVCKLATLMGWWWHHHTISKYSVAGWPDLVLLRDERALFVELKKETGKLSVEQAAVHAMMTRAGLEVHVWRPSDWEDVVRTLR